MDSLKISSWEELYHIDKSSHIELLNDIDGEFVKIPYLIELFKGELNGNGHIIRNIILSGAVYDDAQRIALINYMSHAVIRDVRFENIVMEIDKGLYSPKIAGLCVECYKSSINNVSMEISTADNVQIPLILEKSDSSFTGIEYKCNGRDAPIYEY